MTPLPPLEIISHLLNGYNLEPIELGKARQILHALSVELESRMAK